MKTLKKEEVQVGIPVTVLEFTPGAGDTSMQGQLFVVVEVDGPFAIVRRDEDKNAPTFVLNLDLVTLGLPSDKYVGAIRSQYTKKAS